VAGAPAVDDLEAMLSAAGFVDVLVDLKPESREYIKDWLPNSGCEDFVVSANVTARKANPAAQASIPELE